MTTQFPPQEIELQTMHFNFILVSRRIHSCFCFHFLLMSSILNCPCLLIAVFLHRSHKLHTLCSNPSRDARETILHPLSLNNQLLTLPLLFDRRKVNSSLFFNILRAHNSTNNFDVAGLLHCNCALLSTPVNMAQMLLSVRRCGRILPIDCIIDGILYSNPTMQTNCVLELSLPTNPNVVDIRILNLSSFHFFAIVP